MTSFQLAVVAGLLAGFFCFIVLLAILGQSRNRVVMRQILWPVQIFPFFAVSGMELFQNLATRLCSVLSFGMILGAFLNSVAVLHRR